MSKRKHFRIVVCEGDYVIGSSVVRKLGGGSIKRGHFLLDRLIVMLDSRAAKRIKKIWGRK